jgi:uncharacterized membrane protein YbhN (UPF0104 family)
VAVLAAAPGWRAPAGFIAAAALLALSPLVSPLASRLLGRTVRHGWTWLPLRVGDMLVAGLRLWLAFWMVGQPIGYSTAVAMAAAGLLVNLAGITPNGLGLREWLIAGLTAVALPLDSALGAAAAVVDRAIEAVVVAVAGSVAAWRLRHGSARSAPSDEAQAPADTH